MAGSGSSYLLSAFQIKHIDSSLEVGFYENTFSKKTRRSTHSYVVVGTAGVEI